MKIAKNLRNVWFVAAIASVSMFSVACGGDNSSTTTTTENKDSITDGKKVVTKTVLKTGIISWVLSMEQMNLHWKQLLENLQVENTQQIHLRLSIISNVLKMRL